MIVPASADHVVQLLATIDVQGLSIGGVTQQGFGLGQIQPSTFTPSMRDLLSFSGGANRDMSLRHRFN